MHINKLSCDIIGAGYVAALVEQRKS